MTKTTGGHMRYSLLLLTPFLLGATLREPCNAPGDPPLDDLSHYIVTATEVRTLVQGTRTVPASSVAGCTDIAVDETTMIPGATGPFKLTALTFDLGGEPSVVSNELEYFFPDGVPPGPATLIP